MRIDLIGWKYECKGNLLRLEYKKKERLRRHLIFMEDFKNRTLLDFAKTGLNETNWQNAIDGDDPKHSITEEMILNFIVDFHQE